MAWIRQLDSGLWAATVRTPAGRLTETHELRSVVTKWAGDLESDIRRGEFLDPRLAKTPLGDVWEKYKDSRRLEKASRARDESHWKTWVAPRWGKAPVGAILKPDVQTWVNDLEKRKPPVGGWTIIAALNVLKAACELAVDAGLIRSNPSRRVRPPVPPAHEDRVLDADEQQLILKRLDELFPGRLDARLFVETLMDTGGRWEDIAAVKREAVNLRDGLISLGPVMERDGTIRPYPKGARSRGDAGFRDVAVSGDLLQRLKPVTLATPPGTVVFRAPAGGHILYPTWRSRVWVPTLRVPVLDERGRKVKGEDGTPLWTPLVDEPLPTPHDLRHTLGTWLAEAGLELHDRMAALGHDDVRSSQRYTHSSDKRHDKVRSALKRARGG
jgi:integrase